MHVISQNVDGGTTEADGGASGPVGPSVATPLVMYYFLQLFLEQSIKEIVRAICISYNICKSSNCVCIDIITHYICHQIDNCEGQKAR